MYYIQGTGSSTYQNAGYFGDYRAFLAVDGQLSPGNSGFYHSNLETYPWLKIDIRKPDDSDYVPQTINRVQIYQRCDANEIYHQTNFEVRANDGAPGTVYGSPRLVGGKFCGTYRAWFPTGGTSFTVPCPTPVAVRPIKAIGKPKDFTVRNIESVGVGACKVNYATSSGRQNNEHNVKKLLFVA